MGASFIVVRRKDGQTTPLLSPEQAAEAFAGRDHIGQDIYLCCRVEPGSSNVGVVEHVLKGKLSFAGDRRYELLTEFCAYLNAREIVFCRENDGPEPDQEFVELRQPKSDFAEEFLDAIDHHSGKVADFFSRKANDAPKDKAEELRNFVQLLINDLEAGRRQDALSRAVDLLEDLRNGVYTVEP